MNSDEKSDLSARLGELKMLIVALDIWIRDSLIYHFESIGCNTASFDSGKDAQKALSREPFDVIIADYTLSDMGGFDLLKTIHSSHPRIIKLFITSTDRKDFNSSAENMRICIIDKPFTAETINDAFTAFFREQENLATEG